MGTPSGFSEAGVGVGVEEGFPMTMGMTMSVDIEETEGAGAGVEVAGVAASGVTPAVSVLTVRVALEEEASASFLLCGISMINFVGWPVACVACEGVDDKGGGKGAFGSPLTLRLSAGSSSFPFFSLSFGLSALAFASCSLSDFSRSGSILQKKPFPLSPAHLSIFTNAGFDDRLCRTELWKES